MGDLFAHTGTIAREGAHAHDPASLTQHKTLSEARADWQKLIQGKGGDCPCCDRFGKIYARSINKTMARSLIWLAHHSSSGTWVDVPNRAPKWLLRSNQLPTLRWWKLVERKPAGDDDQKHSGMWRVTPLGESFALGQAITAKTVFTYAGEPTGFSEETINISEVEPRFSYEQVMEAQQ